MDAQPKPIILAVDDDAVILNTVVSTLKTEYSVRPFTSGKAALEYLNSGKADLILLDYNMPEMTGFEVLRRLQSTPGLGVIPVIFLTGTISGDSEVQALEMGAVDYISKPVKPQALLTRVRLQLELQRHRKYLEDMVQEKTQHLRDAYGKLKSREDVILMLLARVTDMRDHDTGNHLDRTTEFMRIMVEDLLAHPQEGYILSALEASNIIQSTKLHDLGKIAMPDDILLKPGKLTPEEFEIIKTHPQRGAELLDEAILQMRDAAGHEADSFLKTARDIAYSHHEKWDGTGYPDGTRGTQIPLPGRLTAIVDVYDAVSSARPYKPSFTHEDSVRIILEGSGKHFDPYLVRVFERHADTIKQAGMDLNAR